MSVIYEVPFYENTPDNTHCFQAALRMVLKYFSPGQEYTWEELEAITAKKEGKWTWPIAAMIWLTQNGYDVQDIELFDYAEFAKKGKEYLLQEFGSEIAEGQDAHTDLEQEQGFSRELPKHVQVQMRVPIIDDLKDYLAQGYLLVCNINSAVLKDKEGYFAHSVVVTGADENSIYLHNPGLPGERGQVVPTELFEKAWAYPTASAKNILAIRPK